MKQLLRLLLSRKQYRALRTAMRAADTVSEGTESTDATTADQSTNNANQSTTTADQSTDNETTTRQQPANNPNIPTDGSPIETPTQLKAVLQQMEPYEFEFFVADLWENMGWETTVSAESADKGVDVTARKSTPYDQLVLIQAKRYGPNTTVGSPDIQQYASLKHQQDGVDKVIIVTTNDYTQQARELADSLNVKLVDGEGLVSLLDDHKAYDLVAKYLDFIEPATPDADTETVRVEPEPAVGTATESDVVDTVSTDQSATAVESTVWHKLVAASTLGWGVLFVGVPVMSDTVLSLLFLTAWIGLPVGIYLDSRRLPDGWPKRTWAYVLGSLIWFLAVVPGVVYLWRRRSVGRD